MEAKHVWVKIVKIFLFKLNPATYAEFFAWLFITNEMLLNLKSWNFTFSTSKRRANYLKCTSQLVSTASHQIYSQYVNLLLSVVLSERQIRYEITIKRKTNDSITISYFMSVICIHHNDESKSFWMKINCASPKKDNSNSLQIQEILT